MSTRYFLQNTSVQKQKTVSAQMKTASQVNNKKKKKIPHRCASAADPHHIRPSIWRYRERPSPSAIRGKLADATVSHSGDGCTQGRCDVPPGPRLHWCGTLRDLSIKTRLPLRATGGGSPRTTCVHSDRDEDRAEGDLPTPLGRLCLPLPLRRLMKTPGQVAHQTWPVWAAANRPLCAPSSHY